MNKNLLITLKRPELICSQNFIAGKWVASRSNNVYEISNPAFDNTFAEVQDSNSGDAEVAANAAHAVFPSWRDRGARERAIILKRWHVLILENAEDLAKIISSEQGKPLSEARSEVSYGASYVEWFAEQAVRVNGEILSNFGVGRKQLIMKEPVGVVAAISPWNFPLAMITRKIAPALAAGCTVLVKPAEETPLCALALVKLASEAGVPSGVLNIITASRKNTPDAVSSWINDSRIRKITFTGSTMIGKYLARTSADTLKRLSLELGGNAPFIVFDDADLEAAIDGLMRSKFRNSGQTCVSPNRVYVQSNIYDQFVDKLEVAVRALRIGPAHIANVDIGPMINSRAIVKIDSHVKDALAKGATLVTGGHSVRNNVADGPFYYAPTVLGDATPEMLVHCEETFGPVIPLFRFDSEAEVLEAANNTCFGLAAYFYTNDHRKIWRVSSKLQAGVIGINEAAVASEVAPFGGVKDSGYGREGSQQGLDDYLQIKYLCQGGLS